MPSEFDWERGFDRNQVLRQLQGVRKSDGRSFDAAGYAFWFPVLSSAIRATRIAEPVKAKCIAGSVSDPSLSLTDPDAFLNRCNQEFERLSRRPRSKFVLYTTITYSGPKLFDWIGDDSARIYWHPGSRGFLRKARKAQEAQEFHRKASNVHPEDATLCPIVARRAD